MVIPSTDVVVSSGPNLQRLSGGVIAYRCFQSWRTRRFRKSPSIYLVRKSVLTRACTCRRSAALRGAGEAQAVGWLLNETEGYETETPNYRAGGRLALAGRLGLLWLLGVVGRCDPFADWPLPALPCLQARPRSDDSLRACLHCDWVLPCDLGHLPVTLFPAETVAHRRTSAVLGSDQHLWGNLCKLPRFLSLRRHD